VARPWLADYVARRLHASQRFADGLLAVMGDLQRPAELRARLIGPPGNR
jgi:hypothetical protein